VKTLVQMITLGLAMVMVATVGFSAAAQEPDWEAISEQDVVEVLTQDEDGSVRETTVWLLVQDGEAYVRTGGSNWGANVVRSGELTLRVGEAEYPMTVEFEEDDAYRARIKQGFRDKYGWSDGLLSWIRGNRPKHMRLVSR
jgi:hypothetical protein